jgi:uncharacterized RDD family membrane protein YckC
MSDTYDQFRQDSVFEQVPMAMTPVSTGIRFANFIIDMIVAYALVFGFFFILGMLIPDFGIYAYEHEGDIGFKIIDRLISALVLALIFTLIEGLSKGRSLGKLITGTVAVREDGAPITWTDALKRSFSRIVPFEPFSAFGGHPWHDKWSNTIVVKK